MISGKVSRTVIWLVLLSSGISYHAVAEKHSTQNNHFQPLPSEQVLRKLSFLLKGVHPERSEIQEFKQAIEQDPENFMNIFKKKIQEYVNDERYFVMLQRFHQSWWGLPVEETVQHAAWLVFFNRPYLEILKKDYVFLNYDSVLSKYLSYDVETETPLPFDSGDNRWYVTRLSESEQRFRSMLSAIDFLVKYPDTSTNKNRKRSSFVYQSLLCQSVVPEYDSLPPVPDPHDPHGANPDCYGCHFKLDPTARVFDQWRPPVFDDLPRYDQAMAQQGTFYYRDISAVRQAVKVGSLREFSEALANNPMVHYCIIKNVWDFVYAKQVPLDNATSNELLSAFQKRQRLNDVFETSLNHPYFWSDAKPPPIRFNDIKANLILCGSCHSPNGNIEPKFDPSTYPFMLDPQENVNLLKRIWSAINSKPGYKPMPPEPFLPLSDSAKKSIYDWINQRAHDDQGLPTLTDQAVGDVLDE